MCHCACHLQDVVEMIDIIGIFDFVLGVSGQEEQTLVNRIPAPFRPRQSVHRSQLTLAQLARPTARRSTSTTTTTMAGGGGGVGGSATFGRLGIGVDVASDSSARGKK